MKTYICSKKGFKRFWNRVKGNMKITFDDAPDPMTTTKKERKKWLKNKFNPKMPRQITLWNKNGANLIIWRQ